MISKNYLKKIKIAQLNCRKSLNTTKTVLQLTEFDILLLQEPYARSVAKGTDRREPLPSKDWIQIFSEGKTGRIRAATYVNARSDIRLHYKTEKNLNNNDLVVIKINNLTIANLYNQPDNCEVSDKGALKHLQKITAGMHFEKTVIAGDFNLHHPRWDRNRRPNKAANDTIQWMDENQFVLCSEPDEATHSSGSVIDLVIATEDISETIQVHKLAEEEHDTLSDHTLIPWTIYLKTNLIINLNKQQSRFNMNKIDWECFHKALINKCSTIDSRPVECRRRIDALAESLELAALEAMKSSMPKSRRGRHPKKYWNEELSELKKTAYERRTILRILDDDESKQQWLKASKRLSERSEEIRAQGWSDFLTGLKGHDIWRAMGIVTRREGASTTPELRTGPESWTKGIEERSQVLWDKLLPKTNQTRCKKPKALEEASWPPLTLREVDEVINTLPRKKAPGPDLITGETLQAMWEVQEYKEAMFALLAACVKYGYHPKIWRIGTVIVLRKPNKKSYDDPKSYRPITLLKIPSKVLEKIMQKRLSHLAHEKLPARQFGARTGYSASDAVLELIDYVKDDLTTTTTAMMVDIKGAFDNVNRKKLIKTMRNLGLPETAVRWTFEFTKNRSASLVLDGYETEVGSVSTGVPQGSPISPLLFLIYTTPLYGIVEAEGLQITGFVDDITIYTRGSMENNAKRLSTALNMVCKWAKSMHTEIDLGDKLGFIHFNKKRIFPNLDDISLTLPGRAEKKAPDKEVKLLGITLDRKLDFRAHVENIANKAGRTLRAMSVLGGTVRGVKGTALRSMYLACVRTVMEYGCEVWLDGKVGQIKRLESIQYEALKRIAGAYKGTSGDVLEKEVAVPPLRLRLEHVLASKLTRILFRVDHRNPVFERIENFENFGKKEKRTKKDKENGKNEKNRKNKKNDNDKEKEKEYEEKNDKNDKNKEKNREKENSEKRKKNGENQETQKNENEKTQKDKDDENEKAQKNNENEKTKKSDENEKTQKNEKNEKNEKTKKLQNFDKIRNSYLDEINRDEGLVCQPTLRRLGPWEEATANSEAEAAAKAYWSSWRERKRKDGKSLLDKWSEKYKLFLESKCGKWYKQITTDDKVSPTTNMKLLITADIFKNKPREVLSWITQLRTSNGNFGEYLQKRKVPIDHYNCECGAFETIQHVIKYCPKTESNRQTLRKASPDLKLTELLNTREGLQAIAEFLSGGRGLTARAKR